MFFRRSIRSYVPERWLLEGKQVPTCRAFCEDVALLEASEEGRILAYRGRDLAVGESFFASVGIEREELDFVFTSLATHARVLFQSRRGPILLFADVLPTARRLLAVLPHLEGQETAMALSVLGRVEVAVSGSFGGFCTACAPDEHACRVMAELLFDLDRIFNNCNVRSFSDYFRLIFEFAGCAPAVRPPIPAEVPPTPSLMDRAAVDYLEECLRRR